MLLYEFCTYDENLVASLSPQRDDATGDNLAVAAFGGSELRSRRLRAKRSNLEREARATPLHMDGVLTAKLVLLGVKL